MALTLIFLAYSLPGLALRSQHCWECNPVARVIESLLAFAFQRVPEFSTNGEQDFRLDFVASVLDGTQITLANAHANSQNLPSWDRILVGP